MGIEDAHALAEDERETRRRLAFAEDRVAKHRANECGRIGGNLPTDMERYLKTGAALD